MSGSGSTLTLSGTNTYSGGTTVSSGTLTSASRLSLGSGPVTLSGGALAVTGTAATYPNAVNVTAPSLLEQRRDAMSFGNLSLGSSLSVSGGLLSFTGNTALSGSPAFNVPAGMVLTLAGPVSDGGSRATVTETGGGCLTLSGTSGSFTSGSHFQVNGSSLVAVGQNYTTPGPATGPLGGAAITLNNGTLVLAAASAAATTFNMVSGNAVTLNGTHDTILAGAGAGAPPLPTARSPWPAATSRHRGRSDLEPGR